MKLASYADGSRDGQLVVVSRDLASAHYATGLATRLQQVLDDWNFLSPQLETLSQALNQGKARHAFAFEPSRCLAPLPRAFQWVVPEGDGLRHVASDQFLAPSEDLAHDGPDLAVEDRLAVMVGDVEQGVAPESAVEAVRLVLLSSEVREAGLAGDTAFAPLALTPDELAPVWQDEWRGFGALIARAAARRGLSAGSLLGGAVRGETAALKPGDRLRREMKDADKRSLFGAIELRRPAPAAPAPAEPPVDTPVGGHPKIPSA